MLQLYILWFFNMIVIITLSIHPISEYLSVWNAVYMLHNLLQSLMSPFLLWLWLYRYHSGSNILDSGWDNCKQHEMCPLQFLSVLSLIWSSALKNASWVNANPLNEATWSYISAISGEIGNYNVALMVNFASSAYNEWNYKLFISRGHNSQKYFSNSPWFR